MRLGINDHTFYSSGIPPDAFDYIDRVSELGLGGIHFSTSMPFSSLSDDYMLRLGERIRELAFYVELGMGACNPYSSCRAPRDVNRDPRETLRELIHVAGFIGAKVVRTLFGFLE
jgi:sugar phosphate isomerase/epimerase